MEPQTVAEAAKDVHSDMYQTALVEVTNRSHHLRLLVLVVKTALEQILPPEEMQKLEINLQTIQREESSRKYYETQRT